MKYYISDQHFFQAQFVSWRGYSSLEDMNRSMAEKWNAKVKAEDEVYILGDFSHGSAAETADLLRSLNGRKTLLIGNHDEYLSDPSFDRSLFAQIANYLEIWDGERYLVLCHYPIPFYNKQYRHLGDPTAESFMLYGHLHSLFDESLLNSFLRSSSKLTRKMEGFPEPVPVRSQMINCFCRFCDYAPLSLDEWLQVDAGRRASLPDVKANTY